MKILVLPREKGQVKRMPLLSEWRALNRANWDEKTQVHLTSPKLHYKLDGLRAGTACLDRIASDVLGPVAGMRVLHLQCHFGQDTLTIARNGADVVGLDFSPVAVTAARALAEELNLSDRARFVEADVYDALAAVGEPSFFDRVFVSWGAIIWLPDLRPWARLVASFLTPGGYLALAEVHPAAFVFDDRTATGDERPGWYAPYLAREPLHENNPLDYADPDARIMNSQTVEFLHPLSDVVSALIDAGLRITWFHEHDSITWAMFRCLVQRGSNEYAWPDRPWLPLSFSLRAERA
jgi:SAM-dependent methyltransferase